jgi:uncharacterized protein YjbI with pentapeptide repeats
MKTNMAQNDDKPPQPRVGSAIQIFTLYQAGERNFSATELRELDLAGFNLRGADLSYANLGHARLQGANLRGADLSYADLEYANLTDADLRGALLLGTNLRSAILTRTNFQGADCDRNTHFPQSFPSETAGLNLRKSEAETPMQP